MKYSKEKIKECAQWVRENGLVDFGGATKTKFCKAMSIDVETLRDWMKKTEFSEAIKNAQKDFKDNLEVDLVTSLAKSAKGYTYKKTRKEYAEAKGSVFLKKQSVEDIDVQPNVGAAIFLLTNIAPDRWKNRQTQDVKADIKGEVKGEHDYKFSNIPSEAKNALFELADKMQEAEFDEAEKTKRQ